MNWKLISFTLLIILVFNNGILAQNNAEREEWFKDLGFGMFIHWSFDSQLGVVISHSMAGASDDYLNRFVYELPKSFNPNEFNPDNWASLAKLAGMKYVVFTAKHHSGFCMWNTKTTSFNVMNTPFGRDIVKEVVDAFRKQNIAIGLYFSPEDFNLLYENKIPIGRLQHPLHYPENNKALMQLDQSQIKELLTNYGKIDVLFFDGPAAGLKELAWKLQPNIVVTRGEMNTPEQELPSVVLMEPWEACFTMGTDWQYKPTNDPHKTGTKIINMLIETRAKGGNLLLNIGPKPNGEIQIEQETLLREIALWNFVNSESIYGVRPFLNEEENQYWFTKAKSENSIYVYVQGGENWPFGKRKNFVFESLQWTDNTRVEILGNNSKLIEYRENADISIQIAHSDLGLVVSAVNGQRLYTNYKWPNPVVLKITNAIILDSKVEMDVTGKDQIDGMK
ncbi:MAG: alpha-L-fucosidase [Bacteroidales bacterium]|nr:alpha-L-fucosidase [Bacteroidales bacterium]